MRRCVDWYAPAFPLRVLDLGSSDVNGSYRPLFGPDADYMGVDLEAGPGVDIVLDDPYRFPFPDGSIDLTISGQMLEHCAQFWRVFTEMARVLKDGGIAFVIAPSAGPIHRFPVDCYRFYPDSFAALAEWSGLRLVHWWLDERGPWRDLVGVFQKGGTLLPRGGPPPARPISINNDGFQIHSGTERVSGQRDYLGVLADLHTLLQPSLYLEIGVRRGGSLKLCQCEMIGIDPSADLVDPPKSLAFYPQSSDDFFFWFAKSAITRPIDFAFIDGMHLVEFVYRDFINLERRMSPKGVIVIDDIFPNDARQATRARETRVWSGDVWRIVPLLQRLRPDLKLTLLDVAPTGLLVVTRLDPGNRKMSDEYNPTIRQLLSMPEESPPLSVLSRAAAVEPSPSNLRLALGLPD